MNDASEAEQRLKAVRAKRGYLLPHHGLLAVAAPDLLDAYDATYTALTLRPKRLILAPGAHERPVPVPGWTLPGVMTTGALQTLARAQRVSPAARVVTDVTYSQVRLLAKGGR